MDLRYPADSEALRAEIADFTRDTLSSLRATTNNDPILVDAGWQEALHESGWAVPTWPVEYGGRGHGALAATIALEEFAAAGAPIARATVGELLLGPTILRWGTDEQKAQFLPAIASGTQTWCQGFSEPGSGSDLASLRTRAEVTDNGDFSLRGHKIWTSEADQADFMFTLAVTDPDVRPHSGISYLLVPLKQPGVEVRQIPQPDGRCGFNEVFLDGAICPAENVLGGVGNGWAVAMGTLGFERGVSATASHHRYRAEWTRAAEMARTNGCIDDPGIRERLVKSWSEIELLRLQSQRFLTAALHGNVDPNLGAAAATYKFFYTELHQRLMNLAMDIAGPTAALLTGESGYQQPAGVGMGQRDVAHDYPGRRSAVDVVVLALGHHLRRHVAGATHDRRGTSTGTTARRPLDGQRCGRDQRIHQRHQ